MRGRLGWTAALPFLMKKAQVSEAGRQERGEAGPTCRAGLDRGSPAETVRCRPGAAGAEAGERLGAAAGRRVAPASAGVSARGGGS